MSRVLLPPHWRLQPDRQLRRKDAGRVLIGGSPMGIIRLSEAGAATADALLAGEPIGADPERASLADRLVDRGMAHPLPEPPAQPQYLDVTVIIPVRDDAEGVARTIGSLPNVAKIVVVDDASEPPLSIDISHPSPSVVRRTSDNVGPGQARNLGLAEVETPFVLFVDAAVELGPDTLAELLAYVTDEQMVAVGARVSARPPDGPPSFIDRYEADHSPLDLGPWPSPVRPGAPVAYLPTACLLVRRHSLREVGPFDPELRYGEDVDLIWRLRSVGTIRYVPTAVASHPPRSTIESFARQRLGYGSAAGPLGRRHGAAVAPLRSSRWTLVIVGLALSGHTVAALGLHGLATRLLVPKLGSLSDPVIEAARLTTTGNVWAARTVARSAVRSWWPIAVLGLALPPTRRVALRWLGWALADRMIAARSVDPAMLGLGLIDDVSYGSGVWLGALRSRSLVALCPATNDQSTSGRFTIKSSSWTTSRVSMLRKRIWSLRSP